MNRRTFLHGSLALNLAAISSKAAAAEDQKPAAEPLAPAGSNGPLVVMLSPDTARILWRVNALSTGEVQYGETAELGLVARGARDGLRLLSDKVLAVTLQGLKPGQKLHFKTVTAPLTFPNHYGIKRGESVSSPAHVMDVPGLAKPARIAMWQDTHQNKATIAALRAATKAYKPDLLLLNGDLVKDQFMTEESLLETFFSADSGFDGLGCPLLFVRGNHEARGKFAWDLDRYAPRPNANGWFTSLRIGGVGVVTLDTGEDKDGDGVYGGLLEFAAYRELQKNWLEKEVREPHLEKAAHRILFTHIPLRWNQPERAGSWCKDGSDRWTPVLRQSGFSAVLSGHTHRTWLGEPDAQQPWHQVTGGGPALDAATFTTVEEKDNDLHVQVQSVEAGRTMFHFKVAGKKI